MNTISRNKLLFFTGLLGVFGLIGMLVFILISDTKESVGTLFDRTTPTPISQKVSEEALATAYMKLAVVSPTSVVVFIDPKDEVVSAVQVQLQYDPEVLESIDITPGTLIPDALILTKKIDPTKGTIFFAIAVRPNTPPLITKGTLATVSFQKKSLETTKISFLPLTKITSFGIDQSVLQSATDVIIE